MIIYSPLIKAEEGSADLDLCAHRKKKKKKKFSLDTTIILTTFTPQQCLFLEKVMNRTVIKPKYMKKNLYIFLVLEN